MQRRSKYDRMERQILKEVEEPMMEPPPSFSSIPCIVCISNQKAKKDQVEILFSASGGLFAYQFGVAAYLQENFNLDHCMFSGSSGGAWAAMVLAAGINARNAAQLMRVVQGKRLKGKWLTRGFGEYGSITEEINLELFKEVPDIHERLNERKNLAIAVTHFPSFKPERHTTWTSPEDLNLSIIASSLVPFAMSGKPWIEHRGNKYVDGCVTNFKGAHCDVYSTWMDIKYHTGNLLLWLLRVFFYWLGIHWCQPVTAPFARLLHQILPMELESPHEVVAPIKSTTGSSNTKRLVLTPWSWRRQRLDAFMIPLNNEISQQKFDTGYEDAKENHHQLEEYLTSLVPVACDCNSTTR